LIPKKSVMTSLYGVLFWRYFHEPPCLGDRASFTCKNFGYNDVTTWSYL